MYSESSLRTSTKYKSTLEPEISLNYIVFAFRVFFYGNFPLRKKKHSIRTLHVDVIIQQVLSPTVILGLSLHQINYQTRTSYCVN